MGLSLNNIYQRPYVQQERKTPVKRREEDEKSAAANTQREEQANPDSKSKGLQYVEQKKPSYTPAYEQRFSMPANNAYSNVNVNINPAPTYQQAHPNSNTAPAAKCC